MEGIGDFLGCGQCHKWIPELDLPTHAGTCSTKIGPGSTHKEVPAYCRIAPSDEEIETMMRLIKSIETKEETEYKNPLVGPDSMRRLAPGVWLNDEIINAHMSMLNTHNEQMVRTSK